MNDTRKFAPPKIIVYWVSFLGLGLIFLELFRLAFLLRYWHLTSGIPVGDIISSFVIGAKFDISILSYAILPFFLISFIPGLEGYRVIRRVIQGALYTIFSIVFLLSLIDIEYYSEYGERLGVWFYAYIDHIKMVWYSVSSSFPVGLYAILWLIVVIVFLFSAGLVGRIKKSQRESRWPVKLGYFLVSLALLVIGMRGGVSLAALDWGSAYHCNYGFANDLALNGIFTLSHSLYEDYSDKKRPTQFQFMSSDEALKTVQESVVSPIDSLLEPDKSLKRLSAYGGSDSANYNVVIIIMESWSAKFVGTLGGSPDATPFFDSLSEKSLLFNNFYASGLRTNRGLLSTLCSFPSLPGRTVMKRYGAPHPFRSIADILDERGYDSYFIYGGDLGFENMEGFFRNQGVKNFIGIDDFPVGSALNRWGVPDHKVFERANRTFTGLQTPFLGVVVTLSNHEPFKLPGKEFEVFPKGIEYRDYLNTFYYSDWAIGQFFHQAEKEEYFKHTIFVLVGDHGRVLYRPDDMRHNFRIACLIYCPGRDDIKPQRIETVCGQVDLVPTILALLGKPAMHESWGRNILEIPSAYNGYAFLNKNEGYGWVEDSLMVREEPGAPARLCRFPSDSLGINDISPLYPEIFKRMRRQGEAMLQLEVDMVHRK
jgi:phosphoglycerol transferase MdoB-like AlkP superfamily enzyme